jgi:hypothetical protein
VSRVNATPPQQPLFDECEGESDVVCMIARSTSTREGFEAYCNIVDGMGECIRVARNPGTISTGVAFPTPAPSTLSSLVPPPPSLPGLGVVQIAHLASAHSKTIF